MRAWVTKGAVKLTAEEYPKTGELPVDILTQMEKDMLRSLCGRVFKARDRCNAASSKKGIKKGTLELYLTEIVPLDLTILDDLTQIEEIEE